MRSMRAAEFEEVHRSGTRQRPAGDARSRKLKVLVFAPRECWPPHTGAKLRNYYLARSLAGRAEVTYLSFADSSDGNSAGAAPEFESALSEPAALFQQTVAVGRTEGYSISNILRGIVGRTPLTVLNYTTREMAAKLATLLDETDFDIVQMESLHLSAYLPIIRAARSQPFVVCDWHNVESELMHRYSQYETHVARRLYAKATARRIRGLEQRMIAQFDTHIVVSERDQASLLALAPGARIFVVENGVHISRFCDAAMARAHRASALETEAQRSGGAHTNTVALPRRKRLVFVGSMDYHANEDAAAYFAKGVWPRIYAEAPDFKFTIVGRKPGPVVRSLANLPGVEVTGTIDDVRPYYREAFAAVVPLRAGGGSRLKILESMAAGVPVISTSLGAEGLEVTDGENILLADSVRAFRDAVNRLAIGPELWAKLASAGRELVSRRYAWSSVGDALALAHQQTYEGASGRGDRGLYANNDAATQSYSLPARRGRRRADDSE
jgi:glycosyltransferase involved in cell wall biosynthesis